MNFQIEFFVEFLSIQHFEIQFSYLIRRLIIVGPIDVLGGFLGLRWFCRLLFLIIIKYYIHFLINYIVLLTPADGNIPSLKA